MTLLRELYRRRRWGSTLSIMFDGGLWEFVAAELNWEPDDTFSVPEELGMFLTRAERAYLQSCIDHPHWQYDHLYCWWCWSLLGPYESDMQGNPVCEECVRSACGGMTTRTATGAGTGRSSGIPGGLSSTCPCVTGARGGI